MHILGQELFAYEPEIEHTLWNARRGKVIIENQLEGCTNEVHQNMVEATRQGENNPQVLNPPRVNPPPKEAN